MISKINDILKEIDQRKKDLVKEYEHLKKTYSFYLEGRKVIFTKKTKEYNKKFKEGLVRYIFTSQIRHIISAPFIYMIAFPVFILDIFLFIYQQTCFRLYGIPFVKRKDYIIYDRKYLDYLNIIEKLNCLYCSRVNGLFSFAVEIAGRTERYWCPIKASRRLKATHNWQKYFADYGDPEGFKECFNKNEIFYKELD
nr:hypothetical protein [Candidatus Gracilibacteria bacterium]